MTPLAALLLLLTSHELIDVREAKYLLRDAATLASDAALIADRVKSLQHAPPTSDVMLFAIPRVVSNHAVSLNRDARAYWMRATDVWGHAPWIQARLEDLDLRYKAWDSLRDAQADYMYAGTRRLALATLRQVIGSRAYYAGRMPEPVTQEYVR